MAICCGWVIDPPPYVSGSPCWPCRSSPCRGSGAARCRTGRSACRSGCRTGSRSSGSTARRSSRSALVRVVGRVEPGDQAVLERQVTRGRAHAAGGVGRGARAVVALGQVRVALLEEGPLVLVLGDVVAPPLVHVLVVERAEADRAALERDLGLHLLGEAHRGRPMITPLALNGNGPLNVVWKFMMSSCIARIAALVAFRAG